MIVLRYADMMYKGGRIMFFQIKAIRKETKPPIWRRVYIPSNITFAQLALLLETILEYPESDQYEFEFFHKKDRIIEWHEEDASIHDYSYSYLNAPDTFINEWMMNEKWFTFRLRKHHPECPDYRVEIEKRLESIRFSRGGDEIELNYPLILKEVSVKNDRIWTDGKVLNAALEASYFTRKAEAEYLYISELRQCIEAGQGIAACDEMVNRDIHSKKSMSAMLAELSERILSPLISQRMEELKEKLNYDEENDTINASQDTVQEAVESLFGGLSADVIEETKKAASDWIGFDPETNHKRHVTLEGMLKIYTKQELSDMAEEYGFQITASGKGKMAHEMARYLLDPQNMRELLLEADESELDAFEAAMEKGCFTPTEEEWQQLAEIYELDYIAEYNDGKLEVPEEVSYIYNIIKQNGYREFHAKAYWLIICLTVFRLIHVVAPNKTLYRMYRQNKTIKADYQDFLTILSKIPDRLNPCSMVGDKVVSKDTLQNQIYKKLEKQQRDVDYYIPTMTEMIAYWEDGYPTCEKAYSKLYEFFCEKMHLSDEVCDNLCLQAFYTFATGGMLSDFMDILNEKEIVFEKEELGYEFSSLMMQVNNNTRMFCLKGHKPIEMTSSASFGKPSSIVPMSNMAAQMHFSSALNGKTVTSSKKIYPNDPCPCGSGKKYKKCCGRK